MKILHLPILRASGLLFFLIFYTFTVEAQLVREEFNQISFIEDFQSNSGRWPNANNADNLLVIQKGAYYMDRMNNKTSYTILPALDNELNSFRLLAAVSVDQSLNNESAIGIMFMIQPNGKGAFVIEVNNKREFRIKQLKGNAYVNISGDVKSNGWVKSNSLIPGDAYNTIEVRTHLKNYDVYLNTEFVFSFSELTYKSGNIGVILGPGTKGKMKTFEIYLLNKIGEPLVINTKPGESSLELGTEAEKTIVSLKKQMKILVQENDKLKAELEKKSNAFDSNKPSDIQKAMRILEDQLVLSNKRIDSLEKAGVFCKELIEIGGGKESNQLLIQISDSFKNEIMISEALRRKNQEYEQQLKAVLLENEKLRKK